MVSGIIRRIDELGRIVIPKEIRKKLKIKIGEPLELSVIADDKFVVKKYSAVKEILNIADDLTKSVSYNTKKTCIITDTEKVVSCDGDFKKEYDNKELSSKLIDIMYLRNIYESKMASNINIFEDDELEYKYQYIIPIIASSNIVGSIILTSFNSEVINDTDKSILKTMALFLGDYIQV